MRQIIKIRKGYWTTPVEVDTGNKIAYCMGWLRVEIPSAKLSEFQFSDAKSIADGPCGLHSRNNFEANADYWS